MLQLLLSALLGLCLYVHADDENVEAAGNPLDMQPSAVIGSVNVITGRYQTGDIDFTLMCPEPFVMQRAYISADTDEEGSLGQGWSRNYFAIMHRYNGEPYERPYFAKITEELGLSYEYKSRDKRAFALRPGCYEKGITNCSSGMISAHTNILNAQLTKLKEQKLYLLEKSSGVKSFFTKLKGRQHHWQITEEKLTNGNTRLYTYDKKFRPQEISAWNRLGMHLGAIQFTYAEHPDGTHVIYIASQREGVLTRYRLAYMKGKKSKKAPYLIEVIRPQAPMVNYDYEDHRDGARHVKLRKKSLPGNRFEEIEYYRKGYNRVGKKDIHIKHHSDPRDERVKLIKAPVGVDATPIVTHRYKYLPGKESDEISRTRVYDALDHVVDYEWNDADRLVSVRKYTGTHSRRLYSQEKLYWRSPKKSDANMFLSARTLEDHAGNIKFVRSLDYDKRGNILKDTLWGNITGNSQEPCLKPKGLQPIEHAKECYVESFTYSQDELGLVNSHTRGENCTLFSYLPGTDLLVKKLHTHLGKIYKRAFYAYDASGLLIKEIEDDGTTETLEDLAGVTQRKIKSVKLRQEAPYGLPEVIDETYLSSNGKREILFRKTVHAYNAEGRLIAKHIYDSHGQLFCTLHWEYDRHGNVITEKDALGNTTVRKYDENNNKIFEQGPHLNYHTEYMYDFSNRLVQVREIHDDGIHLIKSYKYNYLGQKIAAVDIYGNQTDYVYDDLGRLKEVISPPVPNAQGNLERIVEKKEYDLLGHITKSIDGRGLATVQENTIRGKTYLRQHADGTSESFEYNLEDTLKKHTAANQNYTLYQYDPQLRPIKESYYAANGQLLSEKSCQYSTFNLISETDAAGIQKLYKYDGAGRLKTVRRGDNRTSYEYDSMGREYKVIEWDGQGGGVVHVKLYDLMHRLLEERVEDIDERWLSKVSYAYDAEGQKICTVTHTDKGEAIARTYYDSRHQICKIVDAAGRAVHIVNRYDFRNSHGQIVPYCETTDAEGNVTITIKDALGRLQTTLKKNAFGTLLQQQDLFYDQNGNKLRQVEYQIEEGSARANLMTEWSYDSMNQVVAIHEAAGQAVQKCTYIRYNQAGQKRSIIKPDGVKLSYAYDARGRLSSFRASDLSFAYHYEYDLNGNLLAVRNSQDNSATLMRYDGNDRLIEETLANGLQLSYSYDRCNKPLEVKLPDGTGIGYKYCGDKLTEVHKLSDDGTLCYKHTYDSFNLAGQITAMTLIGNAGQAAYEYDQVGRCTKVTYDQLSAKVRYDRSGNVLSKNIIDGLGNHYSRYGYDHLYQLVAEKSDKEYAYQYDSLMNRIAKNGHKYSLNALNALISDKHRKYTYDANGNPIAIKDGKCTTKLHYDALDRLINVVGDDQDIVYTYDSQNRRLSKKIYTKDPLSGKWSESYSVRFLYVGQNEIGSYTADERCLELRLLGHGRGAEIGAAVALELMGEVYAPLHDQMGHVVALIEAQSGNLVETYRYTAFGEHTFLDKEGRPLEQALSPWLFSSKRYDSETGFVYFGRRYYHPDTGRWLTSDPIGIFGGPNLYAYVLNNPLSQVDLYGLYAEGGFNLGAFISGIGNLAYSGLSMAGNYAMHTMAAVGALAAVPGQVLNFIGYHVVPVPFVRDVMQIAGKMFAGQDPRNHQWSFKDYSGWYHLGLPESNSDLFIINNGICCSFDDIHKRACEISQENGNQNVYFFHNSTEGFMSDLCESLMQKLGMRTHTGDLFSVGMRELITAKKFENPHVRAHVFSHSQGGIMLYNSQSSLEDLCGHIDAYTFGSAKLITNSQFHSSTNFVSVADGVPMLDPIGLARAIMCPSREVVFLPSASFPLIDHAWDGAYKSTANKCLGSIRNNRLVK